MYILKINIRENLKGKQEWGIQGQHLPMASY